MSTEAARPPDPGSQFLLETSILRTLCLTVNSDGSEMKYRILDALSAEDFYFPVTKTVFAAVESFHREGDQVVAASLQEVLQRADIDIPDDFHVEDLFRGSLPSTATLSEWLERLGASSNGGGRAEKGPEPAEARPEGSRPAPPLQTLPPEAVAWSSTNEEARFEESSDRRAVLDDVLVPESGQWLGFLAELTKKQGERLKTGFAQLDAERGGLLPGLFLLAGENRAELLDFLKQLVDQIAVGCRGPCLYLSFERSKAALRLQTLSRLSGAPAVDIEKGRFGKDSTRWQDVVRAGEHAVEWLQRIYVVETTPGLSVTRIRELRQGLLDSGAGAPRLVAVDNLEKLSSESDLLQSVAELKELAEAFGIVVVGAATRMELVHERSADLAATFHRENGRTLVKLSSGRSPETVLRFEHHAETHRFEEHPASH